MFRLLALIVSLSLSLFLFAQPQLDVQGDPNSTDTVATVRVRYTGLANIVGLAVESTPLAALGIAGSFYGGFRGVLSESTTGIGLYSTSFSNYGLLGISQEYTGAYVKGGGGIALELGGVDSEWDTGADDGVLTSEQSQVHGDLILVSNDELDLHLDDDNNSISHFSIRNGEDKEIFTLDEAGELTLSKLYINGDAASSDTLTKIKSNYTGPAEVVGLAVHAYPRGPDSIFISLPGVGGYFKGGRIGIYGNGITGAGVHGKSGSQIGVLGESKYNYSFQGYSEYGTGAYIEGDGGIALELGGATSIYGHDDDDAVIRSQEDQTNGDLVLVSNDVIALHLDDDNNTSGSVLEVRNGANTEIFILDEAGNVTITGSYNPSSDLNRKENITSVDPALILDKLTTLPISAWQFKEEDIRHMGPMAQDFYRVFGLGKGETTISTLDADGVALAAIQALKAENEILTKLVNQLAWRIEKLENESNEHKSK